MRQPDALENNSLEISNYAFSIILADTDKAKKLCNDSNRFKGVGGKYLNAALCNYLLMLLLQRHRCCEGIEGIDAAKA